MSNFHFRLYIMDVNKYFVIAKFEDTQEIEVTSSTWLSKNNTMCCWPNYKSPNKTVKAVSHHETVKKDWKQYKVKILGQGRRFGIIRSNFLCFYEIAT